MGEPPDDLRTPKQLARVLDVSVNTVRRWMRDGTLRGWKIGSRWRASEAEARALLHPVEAKKRA